MKQAKRIGGKNGHRAAEVARRIGEAARANRVVLFGSAARGEMRERSDWDFLVVIADRRHRWKATSRAMDAVRNCGFECPETDIIVAREAEVRKFRDNQYCVIKHALDEGRELWHV